MSHKFKWEEEEEEQERSRRLQPASDLELRRQRLLEEKRQLQQKTLADTSSSLGLIYESEQVGIETAEELAHQREQLENINEKLDDINATMRVSQKHINAMKSFFGGIKSYFKKGSENPPPPLSTTTSTDMGPGEAAPQTSTIRAGVEAIQNQKPPTHPALRTKAFDTSAASPDQLYEQKFNENLEEMTMGLGRLKQIGLMLGDEIEDQNVLIDDLSGKASRAEDSISHQNMQIKRLMKK